MAFISIPPPAFPDAVILLSSPAVDSDIHGSLVLRLCVSLGGNLCDVIAKQLHFA